MTLTKITKSTEQIDRETTADTTVYRYSPTESEKMNIATFISTKWEKPITVSDIKDLTVTVFNVHTDTDEYTDIMMNIDPNRDDIPLLNNDRSAFAKNYPRQAIDILLSSVNAIGGYEDACSFLETAVSTLVYSTQGTSGRV